MKKILFFTMVFAALFFISVPMTQAANTAKGVAKITGTAEGSTIGGVVRLTETDNGLEVDLEVTGLPPGEHAFHIHQFGSCEDTGKAAGSHYNPLNAPHGFLPKNGLEHAHAGDMGNVVIGENGNGTLKLVLSGINLTEGKYNVAGRAVIIHEKVDDFGQPVGNAGGRIACGIIGVTEE